MAGAGGAAAVIRPVETIRRKRDGEELPADELRELVLAHVRGEVGDEQMAAFLMAVVWRGMTTAETVALTEAMVASGDVVDLSALGRRVVDKHSTGGVGDKVSIALAPIVAACGVPFAKMSGRGLGHTGGTLDKLESIPGFRIELDTDAFVAQVAEVGAAIVSQSANLAPADGRLYALRDVTATVESIPLIAASIMSKKIAAGADAILLDVKVGRGAFMRTLEDARELAVAMRDLGARAGRRVVCELTDMSQPLGNAVGNAVEIREVVQLLEGAGPPDLHDLVLGSAAQLLALSDLGVDLVEGRRRAEQSVASGEARERYERWVRAQGGDPDPGVLPVAPVVRVVPAAVGGTVQAIDALAVGIASAHLGAGRQRKGDPVDHATGIVLAVKRGATVAAGEPLAEVHARSEAAAEEAATHVAAAVEVGEGAPPPQPLVLDLIA